MKNQENLSQALFEFQKQYPMITSADLQTFVMGWNQALKSLRKRTRTRIRKINKL